MNEARQELGWTYKSLCFYISASRDQKCSSMLIVVSSCQVQHRLQASLTPGRDVSLSAILLKRDSTYEASSISNVFAFLSQYRQYR